MADFISSAEFKTRQNITQTTDDAVIAEVISEASQMVRSLCGREFDDAGSASARVFHPVNDCLVVTNDFSTTTGLVIETDTGNDGTYATTWDAADYELEPLNGVGIDGLSGWPYWQIHAVKSKRFPRNARASVRVTARWGWASVPADVKGATYLIANRLFEERKVPFGTVGSVEFGALPIRDQRTVTKMLAKYNRNPPLVA